ncbi:putative ribonuclease H-like domain-containing protein [Tanacetum coccineum]
MDLETNQNNVVAKLPLLKQVIENENSFKPTTRVTTNEDGSSTSTTITVPVTTEEKIQKKNDVKARSMLLMALPNEHLLTFSQYKDAKTLFEAIKARFDGKFDEGFLVGYSINRKAFRVYDSRTRKVEENLHVNFLENKPSLETTSDAGQDGKEKVLDQDYVLLPLMHSSSYVPSRSEKDESSPRDDAGNKSVVESLAKESEMNNSGEDIHADRTNRLNTNPGIFISAYDDEDVGAEADMNNLESTLDVSPIPTTRIDKDHPKIQIIGDVDSTVQTRGIHKQNEAVLITFINKQRRTNHKDYQNCLFACFLSQIEPKKVTQALEEESWVEAMQEELLQFKLLNVWTLVDLPYGKKAIGSKWVFRNKKDQRGIVVRNKSRQVAQGHRQEKGIDYDDVFAPVARIEAISAFLYGTIEEEVYVKQPLGFVDPAFPDKVYKVEKALYGLHQALRACMKSANTPMETQKPLTKDENGADVDVHLYRSMIGSLMYLTSSRPDNMFAMCASLDMKSTTGGCQFLGCRLVSWQCKKQTIVANSTIEVEYIAASNCCAHVLWLQNQLLDFGYNFMKTKIHMDNESAICVVKNPVSHSKTKHIEIRFHFIRDCYEKRLIEMAKIHTNNNVADLLIKAFDVTRKSMDLRMNGSYASHFSHVWVHNMVAFLKKPTGSEGFTEAVDFLKEASIDNKPYTITVTCVRSKLHLADATGISNLPDADIYAGLATLGEQLKLKVRDQQSQLDPNPPYEVTSTGVEVEHKRATTTTSGLDAGLDSGNINETLLRSNETLLQEGHTSRNVEDSMKLHELMVLVPKLEFRINSLEKELKGTKQTFGNAILTLVKKVKSLEVALKRKSKKVIVSESEDEEPEDQGRKIQDIDNDPLVSLVKDFTTPTKTKSSASREVQEEDISPTTLEAAKTLSKVASQKTKSVDKEVGTSFEDINSGYEDISTGFDGINTGSLEVNTSSGPVSAFSTKVSIPSPDKSQREGKSPMIIEETQAPKRTREQILQEEASLAKAIKLQKLEEEEIAKKVHLDTLLAKRMAEEQELTKQQKQRKAQVQFEAQHYTEEDWDVIRAKLEGNAELTKSMLGSDLPEEDFAKKMGTWKLTQLKKLSFKEAKEEFHKLVKQVNTFIPMSYKATKANLKRFGVELQTRDAKSQKIDDRDAQLTKEKVDEAKEEEPTKKIRIRRKQIARKGLHTEKTNKDETKNDEASEKDDPTSGTNVLINHVLVAVKPPSIANYKIIKQRKKGQQRIISWRYYDTCRVHCLNLDLAEIYMLTERSYPLSAEVCKAMLDKKLQGGKENEDCYQLLKRMEKQEGIKKD